MSWSYSGDPAVSDRDHVRFLIGDTECAEQLMQNEEIDFALVQHGDSGISIAAAFCLRHLATRYSRLVSEKVGDLNYNYGDLAAKFTAKADELDPGGLTKRKLSPLPSFGGQSIEDKSTYKEDTDAIQPNFYKGMLDHPDGPPSGYNE